MSQQGDSRMTGQHVQVAQRIPPHQGDRLLVELTGGHIITAGPRGGGSRGQIPEDQQIQLIA